MLAIAASNSVRVTRLLALLGQVTFFTAVTTTTRTLRLIWAILREMAHYKMNQYLRDVRYKWEGLRTFITVLTLNTFSRSRFRAFVGLMARLLAVTASETVDAFLFAISSTMAILVTNAAFNFDALAFLGLHLARLSNMTKF